MFLGSAWFKLEMGNSRGKSRLAGLSGNCLTNTPVDLQQPERRETFSELSTMITPREPHRPRDHNNVHLEVSSQLEVQIS